MSSQWRAPLLLTCGTLLLCSVVVSLSFVLTRAPSLEVVVLYPEEVRVGFVQSCHAEGAPTGRCECVLDWFEKNVAFEDYMFEVTNQLLGKHTERLVKWMSEAILECLIE